MILVQASGSRPEDESGRELGVLMKFQGKALSSGARFRQVHQGQMGTCKSRL